MCAFIGKTTATLKGALRSLANNSVSLITLHIYSLEISDLKISCYGRGEVASSHILSGPKYSRDLSSCVPEEFTLGDRCGKQGVRLGEKAKEESKFLPQMGGSAEWQRCRDATGPQTYRHLGLTPLAICLSSQCCDRHQNQKDLGEKSSSSSTPQPIT